ncbi:hypothetical protein STVIR_5070 [Streptomyces viridochromogenes Tue57]|uniref:Uncharacterized protein n=1 Tax=Streptomyces viridochromogenes Tue57 TaxID=1160705 RepID=L8PF88_STRVR|nr:hypothetical protein STVIR_5070 [Streptomyces viridochromogenes Tue57]
MQGTGVRWGVVGVRWDVAGVKVGEAGSGKSRLPRAAERLRRPCRPSAAMSNGELRRLWSGSARSVKTATFFMTPAPSTGDPPAPRP